MYCIHTLLKIIHLRQIKSCCQCMISISPMTALCRLVWQKHPDLLIRKIKQLWEIKSTNRCFFSGPKKLIVCKVHVHQSGVKLKGCSECVCLHPRRPRWSGCISILFSLHCWKMWVVIQKCRTILHPFVLCIDTPPHDITTRCFFFFFTRTEKNPVFFPSL